MSNQQQQQQQPVSVEDALRLFNEIQQLTVRDAQDNERFGASAGRSGAANPSSSNTNSINKASSAGAAGGKAASRPAAAVGNEAELRRQVELSEAVMKKLHAKNKALAYGPC
jgi:hypothetical protein